MFRIGKFTTELFRRKVVRVVGAYIAVFWLLAQGFASLFPVIGVPDWVLLGFIIVGIAVIPPLAWLSWKYDIVPPQLMRDPKDIEHQNPALSWAALRHDNLNAGYLLLRWTAGDGQETEKRFFKPVSVGRESNNDVELQDQRVSRLHAVLWAENGGWHVRDMDSGNGTFIGFTRVTGTAALPQSCDLRCHPNGPLISVHIGKSAETVVG
jgi:hypothetical protein